MRLAAWILASQALTVASLSIPSSQQVLGDDDADLKCDLPPVISPDQDGLPSADELFSGKLALLKQVERHSAIVKVPSICYDDLGEPDKDERWSIFYELHKVLEEQYPAIHSRMTREKVNHLGLVYTLKGLDHSLKPLMLTAHQDVVPVADASTWKHPPFAAHFDGTWLWGRGASDDKNSLTALLSALETLFSLPGGWSPRRTVVLAFGFDEECSGRRGAGSIAKHLASVWGNDSMAMILDEGGMGLQLLGGDTLYALPGVSEKGHMDVWFELHVLGGHSSIPFPHTGIGIVAEIVALLEAHPYEPELAAGSPVHQHFVCQAVHSPGEDADLTRLVQDKDLAALAAKLAKTDRSTNFRIQTSQSVDLVSGGQKINAMPEVVTLGVNYRVAPQNSMDEIRSNIVEYIQPVVEKYNLEVEAFGRKLGRSGAAGPLYEVDYNGTLVLTNSQVTLPSPVSPTTGPVWDLFSGTIQHAFAFDGGKVAPVGETMTGNTDTRHYLDLTRHVYRWSPTRQGSSINIHTINERIEMSSHMEAVKFYYELIRNFAMSDI